MILVVGCARRRAPTRDRDRPGAEARTRLVPRSVTGSRGKTASAKQRRVHAAHSQGLEEGEVVRQGHRETTTKRAESIFPVEEADH